MSQHDAQSGAARFPGGLPLARPTQQPTPSSGYALDEDIMAVIDPQPAAPVAPVAAPPAAFPAAAPAAMPSVAPAASTPGVQHSDRSRSAETRVNLDDLLMHMIRVNGSDLYLSVGAAPTVRLNGDLSTIPGYDPLTPVAAQECIYGILTAEQRAQFEKNKSLDLAHTIPGHARFRINVFRQRGSVGAVIRLIPTEIKTLDQLGMPDIIGSFADLPRGLVLVTGPTGSGKSTTLAAVIDRANRSRNDKILTIEDPIEYMHQHRGCIVDQREVGDDTNSFQDALRDAMRQRPDIILLGELRDLDTIATALTAAETGHLVLATLHTQSAAETITRIVDVFPPMQQQQVRTQLAATLKAVACQTLVKRADGNGLVAAVEIMTYHTALANLIRTDQLQQIQSELQQRSAEGMQTLNQHLAKLVLDGVITYETGLEKCSNPKDFEDLTGGREGAVAAAKMRAQREARAQGGFGTYGR